MTWKVGEEKSLIPIGVYPALCYGVYEIGEQYHAGGIFNGRNIPAGWRKQVILTWEIPSERITVEREAQQVDMPRAISKFYSQSLDPRSNLRKDLEAWRGKPFDPKSEREFDPRNLLGKPCQLQIIHKAKADGDVVALIQAIMALPKGSPKPLPPENPMIYFNIDEHEITNGIPDWIIEKIKASKQYSTACVSENVNHPVDPGDMGEVPPEEIPF